MTPSQAAAKERERESSMDVVLSELVLVLVLVQKEEQKITFLGGQHAFALVLTVFGQSLFKNTMSPLVPIGSHVCCYLMHKYDL